MNRNGKRRSVSGSSEHVTVTTEYDRLGDAEIERRIHGYERKYGSGLDEHRATFSCDTAQPRELADLMDWENLVEELKARRPASVTTARR